MLKIRLNYDIFGDSVGVYIFEERNGKHYRVKELIIEEVEQGLMKPPTFTTSKDSLKELPNDLDTIGLVATHTHAQKGELSAIKYHLEDMRLLAKVKKC